MTDSTGGDDGDSDWESELIDAVERKEAHPHDELFTFLVETVLPQL